ncbi:MAG: shikimate dehydrogenase [Lentisphaerae bacterium]|nr:shikimate dehydrogenase [Lentisphaerota bacterium]
MLNASTRPYAVLGHPVKHSLSPQMQNAAFAAMGLDAVYLAFDTPPERLGSVLPMLAELGFAGVNLTVPLKETAFAFLEDLDDSARRLRSVNTVSIVEGRMRGYSTDGEGFLAAFREEFNVTPAERRVCIVGCGGAGRAVAIACALAGARELWLLNRNVGRAERLAAELGALMPSAGVHVAPARSDAWCAACHASQIVIQATSVGLREDDPALLPAEAFCPGQWLYDLIYHVPQTPTMRAAHTAGAHTANGLGMLLHQGALSLKIWTGRDPPLACMRRALLAAMPQRSAAAGSV